MKESKISMFKKERKEIAYFMRRLYTMGLTTTSGGNISMLCDNYVLMTPSALDKGRMKAKQIAILTMDGENLTPDLKPTSEKDMHIEIYRKNSNVKAIVHAHPVTASAFACTNKSISTNMMAEQYAVLGIPARAKYATMGTMELAKNVAEVASRNKIVVMDNHGVLATGKNILQAFDRIEVLENAAKTTLITELLNDMNTIPDSELKLLGEIID
ncbi:MAG: class II aldolase/adducin family protein [Bacteroidota bacterium]